MEKVLVVADPEEKYGQNWLICLTPEATDMVFGELEAERLKEEEAARIQEEEERKKREAEEAERNVVFDDKALCPRPYSSETAMETATEIRQASVLVRFLFNLSAIYTVFVKCAYIAISASPQAEAIEKKEGIWCSV